MMLRYRIGRIEGRWKNFVPPVQGGRFRPYCEGSEDCEDEDEDTHFDGSDVSREPSPIFDTVEPDLRRRKGAASSASSVSSAEQDNGMSFFDAETKAAIDFDHAKYPSLELDTQDEIIRKYRVLDEKLRAAKMYDCNYTAYAWECCRYTILATMSFLCLRGGWYGTSGAFLGMLWHQLVFTVHDAGHMGITHNFVVDSTIGMVVANFIGGLSVCWWKRNHNVHHIVTNSPEHDPDIEHIPFFAISHRFLDSLTSSFYERVMPYDAFAKFVIPYQAYLYYIILSFGRFNLYRLSWEHIILGLGPRKGSAKWHRYFELVGQIFFWYWFGYLVVAKSIPTWSARITFILVSHVITMPLHAQITLSHFAMSTAELGPHESFPQKMLRTTMDVDCPAWLDFFHGGLQFQVIHHLFPRMPRHNLRGAQKIVQEFCDDVGIPYALYGFVDGNKQVIGRLAEVGRQASILAKCQRSIVEKGDVMAEVFHGH